MPGGLPAAWQAAGVEWVIDRSREDEAGDRELSSDALNAVDGVMTAATVGVAVSGSIVLQHGPAEGRRVLTLLPDYHLCVIEAAQIVETLPEAFARLDKTRPVTFFSGPSATGGHRDDAHQRRPWAALSRCASGAILSFRLASDLPDLYVLSAQ